jgi:charged multivesicular body protein 4
VEISDTIGSINVGPEVDDVDLEAELEELQQKELDDRMRETGTVPVLPAVANGESKLIPGGIVQLSNQRRTNFALVKGKAPAVAEDDEEEELKRLQAEMAM